MRSKEWKHFVRESSKRHSVLTLDFILTKLKLIAYIDNCIKHKNKRHRQHNILKGQLYSWSVYRPESRASPRRGVGEYTLVRVRFWKQVQSAHECGEFFWGVKNEWNEQNAEFSVKTRFDSVNLMDSPSLQLYRRHWPSKTKWRWDWPSLLLYRRHWHTRTKWCWGSLSLQL